MKTTVTVIYQSIIKSGPAGLGQPNLKPLPLEACRNHERTKHKMLVPSTVVPSIRDQSPSNPVDSKVGNIICDMAYRNE